jgi:hypothetical protein
VWTGLVQLRIGTSGRALVNAAMNLQVSQNAEKLKWLRNLWPLE